MSEGYRQSHAASWGTGRPRRHRELTESTATDRVGTAGPCTGAAPAAERDEVGEKEYAAAKPDT